MSSNRPNNNQSESREEKYNRDEVAAVRAIVEATLPKGPQSLTLHSIDQISTAEFQQDLQDIQLFPAGMDVRNASKMDKEMLDEILKMKKKSENKKTAQSNDRFGYKVIAEHLASLVEMFPDDGYLSWLVKHVLMALAKIDASENEIALSHLKEALSIAEKDNRFKSCLPYIYFSQSQALFNLERYNDSIIELEKAIAIKPESDLLKFKALICYKSKRYEKALEDFNICLKNKWLDKTYVTVILHSLAVRNEWEKTLEITKKLSDYKYPSVYFYGAFAFFMLHTQYNGSISSENLLQFQNDALQGMVLDEEGEEFNAISPEIKLTLINLFLEENDKIPIAANKIEPKEFLQKYLELFEKKSADAHVKGELKLALKYNNIAFWLASNSSNSDKFTLMYSRILIMVDWIDIPIRDFERLKNLATTEKEKALLTVLLIDAIRRFENKKEHSETIIDFLYLLLSYEKINPTIAEFVIQPKFKIKLDLQNLHHLLSSSEDYSNPDEYFKNYLSQTRCYYYLESAYEVLINYHENTPDNKRDAYEWMKKLYLENYQLFWKQKMFLEKMKDKLIAFAKLHNRDDFNLELKVNHNLDLKINDALNILSYKIIYLQIYKKIIPSHHQPALQVFIDGVVTFGKILKRKKDLLDPNAPKPKDDDLAGINLAIAQTKTSIAECPLHPLPYFHLSTALFVKKGSKNLERSFYYLLIGAALESGEQNEQILKNIIPLKVQLKLFFEEKKLLEKDANLFGLLKTITEPGYSFSDPSDFIQLAQYYNNKSKYKEVYQAFTVAIWINASSANSLLSEHALNNAFSARMLALSFIATEMIELEIIKKDYLYLKNLQFPLLDETTDQVIWNVWKNLNSDIHEFIPFFETHFPTSKALKKINEITSLYKKEKQTSPKEVQISKSIDLTEAEQKSQQELLEARRQQRELLRAKEAEKNREKIAMAREARENLKALESKEKQERDEALIALEMEKREKEKQKLAQEKTAKEKLKEKERRKKESRLLKRKGKSVAAVADTADEQKSEAQDKSVNPEPTIQVTEEKIDFEKIELTKEEKRILQTIESANPQDFAEFYSDEERKNLPKKFRAYIAGGSVRNRLLGEEQSSKDLDIVTNAPSFVIQKLFKDRKFNVYDAIVTTKGDYNQTADLDFFCLKEIENPVKDLLVDAYRRDFTINAFYADQQGRVIAPHSESRSDLLLGIIQTTIKAEESLKKDPSRIFRAYNTQKKLSHKNFKIHRDLLKAVKSNAQYLTEMSESSLSSKDNLITERNRIKLNSQIKKMFNRHHEIIQVILKPKPPTAEDFSKLKTATVFLYPEKDKIGYSVRNLSGEIIVGDFKKGNDESSLASGYYEEINLKLNVLTENKSEHLFEDLKKAILNLTYKRKHTPDSLKTILFELFSQKIIEGLFGQEIAKKLQAHKLWLVDAVKASQPIDRYAAFYAAILVAASDGKQEEIDILFKKYPMLEIDWVKKGILFSLENAKQAWTAYQHSSKPVVAIPEAKRMDSIPDNKSKTAALPAASANIKPVPIPPPVLNAPGFFQPKVAAYSQQQAAAAQLTLAQQQIQQQILYVQYMQRVAYAQQQELLRRQSLFSQQQRQQATPVAAATAPAAPAPKQVVSCSDLEATLLRQAQQRMSR